jgi:hypothetical protein
MKSNELSKLHLDSLDRGIPALTSRQAGVHMEACVWCLLECGHQNGVTLTVLEGEQQSLYRLLWPEAEVDADSLARAYNKDDGPEHGAEAIALLLVREKTDYTAIQRSVTSTGIDYWLGYKDDVVSGQIFSPRSARLEVSGILRQNETNRLKARMGRKVKQTKRSDNATFPVYIVVVEFSQPVAEVRFRNV